MPTLCLEVLGIAKIDQGVEAVDSLCNDIPAPATITAVRPAELNVLFAPERAGASTTVAAANEYLGFVEELHLVLPGPVLSAPWPQKERSIEKGGMARHSPFGMLAACAVSARLTRQPR